MTKKKSKEISVIGLGKLGLEVSLFFAEKFNVWGADKKDFSDNKEVIRNSEMTFIIVGTPSEASGKFSNEQILEVSKDIGEVLREKKNHLVVLMSTVFPGSIEGEIIPCMERFAKRKIDFCYNPLFVRLDLVREDIRKPNFILIGEKNKKSGDLLEEFYRQLYPGPLFIQRLSLPAAEIAKLALNNYITMKISYANMLGLICKEEGEKVCATLGLDPRIGCRYFFPGWPFKGPCFPRDVVAFKTFLKEKKMPTGISEWIQAINKSV